MKNHYKTAVYTQYKEYITATLTLLFEGGFFGIFLFMYVIQHCFICRPSDSTVSEDAGIVLRTVAALVLSARRSNHSARSHLDSVRYHPHSARSHPL
jgi:hypothetical protein